MPSIILLDSNRPHGNATEECQISFHLEKVLQMLPSKKTWFLFSTLLPLSWNWYERPLPCFSLSSHIVPISILTIFTQVRELKGHWEEMYSVNESNVSLLLIDDYYLVDQMKAYSLPKCIVSQSLVWLNLYPVGRRISTCSHIMKQECHIWIERPHRSWWCSPRRWSCHSNSMFPNWGLQPMLDWYINVI